MTRLHLAVFCLLCQAIAASRPRVSSRPPAHGQSAEHPLARHEGYHAQHTQSLERVHYPLPTLPGRPWHDARLTQQLPTRLSDAVINALGETGPDVRAELMRRQEDLPEAVRLMDDKEALPPGPADAMVPLKSVQGTQYMGEVSVGSPGAKVAVVFDTGSTNLWVASTKCPDTPCVMRNRFNPDASNTFRPVLEDGREPFLDIQFGTGEIQGIQGKDDLAVGRYTVQQQTFGMIEHEIGQVFQSITGFEGIMGLAFPSMSANDVVPFFDNAIAQKLLQHNEFAFYFNKQDSPIRANALFLGGVDKRFYEGSIHMVPVSDAYYWQAELEGVEVGGKTLIGPSQVIVDSGTTYFTAPRGHLRTLLKALGLGHHRTLQGAACANKDSMPTLSFKVKGFNETVVLDVPASVYMVSSGEDWCEAAFMAIEVPEPHGPAYVLGEVFMRNFLTVFDRQAGGSEARIGFATARHSEEGNAALATEPAQMSTFIDEHAMVSSTRQVTVTSTQQSTHSTHAAH